MTTTQFPLRTRPVIGMRPGRSPRRLVALLVVAVLLLAVVAVRVALLQTVDGDRYASRGFAQRLDQVTLPGERGIIFDRNGNELAISVPQSTIWANPREILDPDGTARALAPVVGVDAAVLAERFRSDKEFVYVARQVDDSVADAIVRSKLPGIHALSEPKRFLPGGDVARSVVGATDVDGIGTAGVEQAYDAQLTGKPGQLIIERDQRGHSIPGGLSELKPAVPGDDIVLTIDRALQFSAEQSCIEQTIATQAKGCIVIVMDPRSGDILAMANVEWRPGEKRPEVSKANLAVVSTFEPGSVNKVITAAAALEQGATTPETVWTVPDKKMVADAEFTDHDPHPIAKWTIDEIMTRSSNIGTILLAQATGLDKIDRYLREFGLGASTGLNLPFESAGQLRKYANWQGADKGSIPLGQGVSVTALQMLSAYNVIANGGSYVSPRLLHGTIGASGKLTSAPAAEQRRVVSPETAALVTAMLRDVVSSKDGTGQAAAISGYEVAGKTGTARKPQSNGTYVDGSGHVHYVSSFAGFVPAENPKLSVIAVIDDPANGFYASQVAAPLFANVAQYALRHLHIPPTVATSTPPATVDPTAVKAGDRNDGPAPTVVAARAPTGVPSAPR